MGNDLISRKEVLSIITPRLNSSKIGSLEQQRLCSILEEIKSMSTAYDVDKVMRQIKKNYRKDLGSPDAVSYNIGLLDAIMEVEAEVKA